MVSELDLLVELSVSKTSTRCKYHHACKNYYSAVAGRCIYKYVLTG